VVLVSFVRKNRLLGDDMVHVVTVWVEVHLAYRLGRRSLHRKDNGFAQDEESLIGELLGLDFVKWFWW
jgi:hypothetical protein